MKNREKYKNELINVIRLEICEVTGGRVIGSGEYNKSDRFPFREDKNDK